MNKRLRQYLQSIGLAADASVRQAWAFYQGLTGEQRAQAQSLRDQPSEPADGNGNDPPARGASDDGAGAGSGDGSGEGNDDGTRTGNDDPPAQPNADDIRTQERERIRQIRDLARQDVPDEMLNQAINEGWSVERASQAFLQAIRDGSPPAAGGGVGIHVRGEADRSVDVLQAAVMLREGAPIDRQFSRRATRYLAGVPAWLTQDVNHDERQRVMDFAHQYDGMSLVDICREAVRLDGNRASYNNLEMIRAAVSGGSLSAIFSTVVNAQLLASYTDADDTTRGWVAETDVRDFNLDERSGMGKFGGLKKLGVGGKADHGDLSDEKETSRLYRYAKQFIVDEQDIINDRFGAIEQLSPADMGNAAAQLRPDLVYALLLANPNMDSDSTALFHANHANLDTNAFNTANLQTGIAKMAKIRIRNRPLNVRARFLIVPRDLEFSADIELTSAERRNQASTDSGTKNPLLGRGIMLVSDDRIGAAGVTDPDSGTAYTGSATNWFLSARPGENGARTLVVKYLRGTGRVPMIRGFQLTQGQWGVGWDINHDIGVDADDYRGLYKGNS